MQRHRLLAAAATATLVFAAAPALAASSTPPLTDGFVSVAAGGAWFPDGDNSDDNEHGMSLEGAASGEYNFTSVLGFQGDVVLQSQHFEFDQPPSDSSTLRNADIALHTFYRDSNQFLLGGLVQFGTDSFSFDGDSFAVTDDRYYAGAEAQYFLGDTTLYGQAGAQQVTFDGQSAPGWFATFEARYFLQPDFKIEAHIAANDFSTGASDFDNVAVNSWNAGVGAEYKFANAPFSIFAKYDFTHQDLSEFDTKDSFDDNRILVGVKFNFGAETLEDRDRSGASLKPVSSPIFAAPEEAE